MDGSCISLTATFMVTSLNTLDSVIAKLIFYDNSYLSWFPYMNCTNHPYSVPVLTVCSVFPEATSMLGAWVYERFPSEFATVLASPWPWRRLFCPTVRRLPIVAHCSAVSRLASSEFLSTGNRESRAIGQGILGGVLTHRLFRSSLRLSRLWGISERASLGLAVFFVGR